MGVGPLCEDGFLRKNLKIICFRAKKAVAPLAGNPGYTTATQACQGDPGHSRLVYMETAEGKTQHTKPNYTKLNSNYTEQQLE